ncbi:MAG: hypothetical protein ACPG06_02125 [Alphaproteobacteria bacterium]
MSETTTVQSVIPQQGLLRNPVFDGGFVFGIAAVALASGIAVSIEPALFAPILFLDLWLLGYHHVVSTYTRLCFDVESARKNWRLLALLPVMILAVVAAWRAGADLWLVATVYLYWQWFHYTRQSWGVSRVYARKGNNVNHGTDRLSWGVFYGVPLWGILHRSAEQPTEFIGMGIRTLPVPMELANAVGIFMAVMLAVWMVREWQAVRRGEATLGYVAYVTSHHLIFITGYYLVKDISHGWLVLNIWHNAQYIGFVWLFNNMRFKERIDPKAYTLSLLSQSKNWWRYGLVCFGISSLAYATLQSSTASLVDVAGPALLIYMAINFHHYIVDSVIWKTHKKPMQKVLDLKGA